jgi:hypothetical protein
MKSGKQRKQELRDKRLATRKERDTLAAEQARIRAAGRRAQLAERGVRVDATALAPVNSYGAPEFVARGYYADLPFRCVACGKDEVWTATQQKWWYEVAKGFQYSTAKRCRACRRREREARAESRRVQLAGAQQKAARKRGSGRVE